MSPAQLEARALASLDMARRLERMAGQRNMEAARRARRLAHRWRALRMRRLLRRERE